MTLFGDFDEQYRRYDQSKIVILPVPYDGTSTWIKGADKGPEALLEASYTLENYDIETRSEVYLNGIFTAQAVTEKSSPEAMVNAVYQATAKHLADGKFQVLLGGEHSVTTGAVKAIYEKYPDVSVLQLDAHSDLRPTYEGSIYNHACVMNRVQEWCPIVQVGIRAMDKIEQQYMKPGTVFFAETIWNNTEWMDKAIDQLTDNVYLTIDLDAFDPSIMPSTGTPEPGGLMWYPVLTFLKKLMQKRNVVGFDVVELCPNPTEKSSDFLAAKLVYKLLSYKFSY